MGILGKLFKKRPASPEALDPGEIKEKGRTKKTPLRATPSVKEATKGPKKKSSARPGSEISREKKSKAQKKTMVCRKCGKEVEYDEKLRACPHCMSYDPGWVMVMPGTKDPRAQKHKEKAGDYYSQGKKRQAISEFKKAAEIDSTDPTIFNNIGGLYMELGDYDEALKYLRKALEIDPDLGPAKRQLKRIQEIVDK